MLKKLLLVSIAYLLLQGACAITASQLQSCHYRGQQKKVLIKQLNDENRLLKLKLELARGCIKSRKEHREMVDGNGIIDMSVPLPFGCICLIPYLCGKASAEFLGYQFVPGDLHTDTAILGIIQGEEHAHSS